LLLKHLCELKNILSNNTGFHKSSSIAILQPALYPGSIAKIFFWYSGLVISSFSRFVLNVFIASSSQSSPIFHLISFSTDLNNVLYQSIKASDSSEIKLEFIAKISAYFHFNKSKLSSDLSILTFNIQIFSHLFNANI